MSKIQILVVEDQVQASEALTATLTEHGFEVCAVARTHAEAMKSTLELKPDLAIIDIFLGDHPDGVAFAESLAAMPDLAIPFVFLTSSKDRSIFDRAKLTRPFAFLLKPFNALEVLYSIEMALEKFYDQEDGFDSEEASSIAGENYLFIKKKSILKKVSFSDILYVEVEDRYCNLYTADEKFVILMSLTRMADILEPHGFERTHRNFMVQRAKITQIIVSEDTVILEGEISLPLSDKYKDLIKRLPTL